MSEDEASNCAFKELMTEVVYGLTNKSLDGIVKIGGTLISFEHRIKELNHCFDAAEGTNARLVENKLHPIFADK